MGYSTIWIAIKAILDSLVSTTTLAVVYNYDAKTSDNYPYAEIIVSDASEEFLDTANNLSTKNFIIRVTDLSRDLSNTEAKMRLLCDNIVAELRKEANETLGWIAKRVLPKWINWYWVTNERQDGSNRIFEINLEVLEEFSI